MISFEVIRDAAGLRMLRPEWDALWSRARAPASLSFAYAMAGWETLSRLHCPQIHCLAGRRGGELVALLPMMTHRVGRLWTVMRPLGPDSTEYSDILLAPGSEADACASVAWKTLLRSARADRMVLRFVREGSPLALAIGAGPPTPAVLSAEPDTTWTLSWAPGQDWENWYGRLSNSYRRAQKKKQSILARSGRTEFEVIEDPGRCAEAVDTLLAWKRVWAERAKPDPGQWLHEADYQAFLRRYVAADGAGRPFVGALWLEGKLIAALVMAAGPAHVDWIIASFDPAHAQSSPGMAMYEHCLQWAHARGLGCDFGPGKELNKRYWCHDQPLKVTSYQFALGRWGELGFRLRRLQQTAKRRLSRRSGASQEEGKPRSEENAV